MILLNLVWNTLKYHEENQGQSKDMSPDVPRLVMNHEQALQQFF